MISAWFIHAIMMLAHALTFTCAGECTFWKKIVENPGFRRHVLATARMARLDIGLPLEFGSEETHFLTNFLKEAPISARIFSERHGFCTKRGCERVRNDRRAVLLMYCRTTVWTVHRLSLANPYVIYLHAISANVSDDDKPPDERIVGGSGVYIFTVRGRWVVVTENDQARILTHEDGSPDGAATSLIKDLPLRGRHIRVFCLYPYFCKSPLFAALPEIFVEANASFEAVPVKTDMELKSGFMEVFNESTTMLHFHSFFTVNLLFPATTVPCHYDRLHFYHYVKGLVPMAKEAVLLLPFEMHVWVAFLISFVLCVLCSFLVTMFENQRPIQIPTLTVLLGASLLRQSFSIPRASSRSQSFRIIFGVWSLTAMVMSTAFQAVLVSLLWKVPLDGELPDVAFVAYQDRHDFRVCLLTFLLDQTVKDLPKVNKPFKSRRGGDMTLRYCLDRSDRIQYENEAKTLFLIFGSGFPRPEKLKKELVNRGYVFLAKDFSPVVSGPELRTASSHRRAMTKLLKAALESGMFEHAARVARLKGSDYRGPPPDTNALGYAATKLSDLRPCFVVLLIGTTFSSFVFTLTVVIYRIQLGMTRLTPE